MDKCTLTVMGTGGKAPPPSANDTFYPKIIAIPKLSQKNTSYFLRDVYFNEKSSPLFEFFFRIRKSLHGAGNKF